MKPDTLDDPEVWARLTTALNKFMKGKLTKHPEDLEMGRWDLSLKNGA